MASEISEMSRDNLKKEIEELKSRLLKSEAEKEELAKDFLNQCDRIDILEATAEDLNERLNHREGFSKAVLDRLRITIKEEDRITKKLSESRRENDELRKQIKNLQLSIVNGKMLEGRASGVPILQESATKPTEYSGYIPSPPLKPVQSILKSRHDPSPPLVRKPSIIHMQRFAPPLKNLQHLPSPPNSKSKAFLRKATSFFMPLNDEKSQPSLKIQRKPSLIPTLCRQSSEKYSFPLQRKVSKIPVLLNRSNTQILPPIKTTQSIISNENEQLTSSSRKLSFRLPLIDVKEFRSG